MERLSKASVQLFTLLEFIKQKSSFHFLRGSQIIKIRSLQIIPLICGVIKTKQNRRSKIAVDS